VEDRQLVALQLGRRPRAFRRVAARCPSGGPAVTEQFAYDDAGVPFPTTYYVTCRHLVAAIARLEAAGGVERWSAEVARDPALAHSLELGNEEQRMLRRTLLRSRPGSDGGTPGVRARRANPRRRRPPLATSGLLRIGDDRRGERS
jgi:hypothetical protein